MDYDEDGKKDLILGEGAGFIKIYINTNTDADPQFSGYSYVKVNGVNMDFGDYSRPYIVDWNNDGKKDILCGHSSGYVNLLINTGTNSSPVFTSSDHILDGTGDLQVYSRSCPVVFDWDDDGKKDLLVGHVAGGIWFYSNQGTDAAPLFDGYENLNVEGAPFKCAYNVNFDVVDWTNDGLTDLIVGCENIGGTPLGPVFYFRAMHFPTPDALVNGQNGPINVPKSTPLEFKIALDPGGLAGVQCDWWVWVERGSSKWWCQYNGGNKKWTKSAAPIRFAGAGLLNVNGYTVLGPRTIPAGTWYFRFAIDELDNTYEGTWIDEVEIVTF